MKLNLSFITGNTTPAEFDVACKKCDYKLDQNGGRVSEKTLQAAVLKENVPLIEHIVQIAGVKLLDCFTYTSVPPINKATRIQSYAVVSKLIELRANVNISSLYAADHNGLYIETPLHAAVQRFPNEPIAKLLLRNGALRITDPKMELTNEGKLLLNKAQMEFQPELKAAINDAVEGLLKPKEDLVNIIASYLDYSE